MNTIRHRHEGGSAGPEGRVLKMPVRLVPESFSPVLFVERAVEEGLVDVALKVEYEVVPDLDWSLQFSFRREATRRGSRSGIESVQQAFYPVHYLPGRRGRYAIVPSRPGMRLRPPWGHPENHRERVIAAFLRANHDLFRAASRPGCRFRVTTALSFEGRVFSTPSNWRLRWLARGYRCGALFPEDRESLRESCLLLEAFGDRPPDEPPKR